MIVFAHIPSAAGSTLWTVFREIYGRMNVKRMRGLGMPVTNDVVQQVVESDRGRVSVVGGHVRVNTRLQHPDGVRFVTFLRDPTAIQISRFLRSKRKKEENPTVTPEMVLKNVQNTNANPLTRFLRDQHGFDLEAARAPVTTDDLERAKETVAEHIHVFGLAKRFDESLEQFRDRLGWGSVPGSARRTPQATSRTSRMTSGRSAASATRSTTNSMRSRSHCSTGSVPRRHRPTPRRLR